MKTSSFFKPFLAGLMALAAAAALALPTPKDIEFAVNAGHLTQAESMLREVIQEKPQSAKAHYELGQVLARETRYADAHTELKKAKELDPTLKFAANPEKFNETYDKVNRLAQNAASGHVSSPALNTPAPAMAAPAPAAPAAPESGFSLSYVWLGIAGLVVFALVLRRNKPAPAAPVYAPAAPAGAGMAPRGFGAQFTPNAPMNNPSYPPGYGPNVQPTGGMGSGIGGAVVGGLAGVAAGYALSKALEGDHRTDHGNNTAANASAANNGGYVPFDTPAQPDLGSFDTGSGSDWDDASSGGGSDDSW
ncbi:M48 family metallopeptidase [Limnohabitans sp. TS-CS-82]|uniref:tetratricopeptide repeat protein n=1 Tax=Limnohabitans sp. TS-CS-82 TaxID=2094193 RepID=UPI0011B0572E|nr:tetratricopeptide repeat protein [Limnohabitans sp. TS-CS-82]